MMLQNSNIFRKIDKKLLFIFVLVISGLFIIASRSPAFAVIAPNPATSASTAPTPVWVDTKTLTVNGLSFTRTSDKKVFTNIQAYFKDGLVQNKKTCTSKLTFSSDPYAKDGGQTATLTLYELRPQNASLPTECTMIVIKEKVDVSNAKAVNKNKANGIADAASPPGSTVDTGLDASVGPGSSLDPICDPADKECQDPAMDCGKSGSGDCGLFEKYINPMISFLSAVVGIAATIGIIVGGIRYMMASDDPGAVSKARALIRNSIVALVVYLLLFALVSWLQPGGF